MARHDAVEQTDGGKVLHAVEAHLLDLLQEDRHQAKGVGAADAGQHRGVLDHRQHLAGHFHDDRVGVAVGQQPGQGAAPGHAIAPGVVDDDEVNAAGLDELGGDAGAGAGADDGPARGDLGAQPGQRVLNGE